MPGSHKQARQQKAAAQKRLWTMIGIAALAVVILAAAPMMVGATLEEKDSFCASCHSQPETTYYQRSIAATPVDMASQHHSVLTKCIDCHSGIGIPGRAGALMLGAGDLFAWVTHTAKQPAPLTQPIGDEHCIKCHQDVEQTQDFNRHFHAFLPRWQAVDPNAGTCVSCHTAHTTDGDPNLKYLNQNRTVQVCQNCHAAIRE